MAQPAKKKLKVDSAEAQPVLVSYNKSMNPRLKKDQKDKLRQFVNFTRSNDPTALACLTSANWNLEMACDIFYQNPAYFSQVDMGSTDSRRIEQLFNKYAKDPADKNIGENRIGPNGMVRLLNDLGVDPTDRVVLALAWKMKAEIECEFSLEEFKTGLTALKADTLESLKNSLPKLNEELNDPNKFREFYQFAFQYAKSVSQRSLAIDTAIAYWQLIFRDSDPRVKVWINFLQDRNQKGVPKDTWNLFLDFLRTTDPTYSNYDCEGAWPVLIDEFVDYAKQKSANS